MATHVRVELDDGFRAEFAAWQRGLTPDRTDRKRYAGIYLAELCQRLVRFGGYPAGARARLEPKPTRYWCELGGGMWAVYTVTEHTTLFTRSRVVRLVALERRPPPQTTPALPPG